MKATKKEHNFTIENKPKSLEEQGAVVGCLLACLMDEPCRLLRGQDNESISLLAVSNPCKQGSVLLVHALNLAQL